MVGKTKKTRLFSLVMAVAMLLSMTSVASAVPADVTDAKDEIATVDIIQTYNGTARDAVTHNYRIHKNEVTISYEATLSMTEAMATYLWYRQTQLKYAEFVVHINMDMDKLEFVDQDADTVSVIFKSTFLKPKAEAEPVYDCDFLGRDADGVYGYQVTVTKEFALANNSFDIPMELITYYDGANAYSYHEFCASPDYQALKYEPLMYENFTVEDWTHPITLRIADMRVKDSVRESVTEQSSTWVYIRASGTVDGTFTYVPGPCSQIFSLEKYGSETTLEFGNDSTIEQWESDKVYVRLIRQDSSGGGGDTPFLNTEDHFAYIIGMPDGLVHPEGLNTRADVATIFFRMLTDEVRNEYWSQSNPYYDVQIDNWYNNAISTLTNLGVVNGWPDGGFHPDEPITRAEFATMAARFFVVSEEYTYDEDAFSDIAGNWANEYINLAYLLEVVHGYPDGTFRPGNYIDRAEAMTIVNNTLRRTPTNAGIEPMSKADGFITWPDNMNTAKWYYAAVQEATNSHEYSYKSGSQNETWTKILPVRDWAAFERAWSDANSASNPGEVVDGK